MLLLTMSPDADDKRNRKRQYPDERGDYEKGGKHASFSSERFVWPADIQDVTSGTGELHINECSPTRSSVRGPLCCSVSRPNELLVGR
jgi:hypothetical protein